MEPAVRKPTGQFAAFFHPDYTVDSGIAPDQRFALVGFYHRSGLGISSLTLP